MKKILIVDDEKMMLKMAARILSKKYETVQASSGAEAIEQFRAERPDMVLSDLLMPEMDGYELHRRLQELTTEPVPIMFMTADESDESESRGFEIGAADYIRKPLKADVLLRRIGNIIDNLDKIHGLKQAADFDPMTGLLNKAAATRELTLRCKEQSGVLMMIDLDSFKLVNDLYGHAMGDKILVSFGNILRGVIRQSDVIGRMGGDEFIAFCNGMRNTDEIANKVGQMNESLMNDAKKLMGEDMNIPLGTSVGCVFAPDEGTEFSELSQKADKALYNVKQHGKHGCAFYSEAHHSVDETESARNISSMRMILGERNRVPGAYFVEFEQFKAIWRLAVRLVDNYQREIQFMQLTLDTEDEALVEEFREVLIKTLRRSDRVTQHGKNQFFVLLQETPLAKGRLVEYRIRGNWTRTAIAFEMESVRGAD